MDIDILISFLGWCSIVNIGFLLFWMFFLICCPEWTYRFMTKWLPIKKEKYYSIHFSLIGIYKLGIILFSVAPYLSLRIIF